VAPHRVLPQLQRIMTDVEFAEELLGKLRDRNPRYHGKAYLFLLSALQFALGRLPEPRHIAGSELAEGVRDLALERFGPVARIVLEHWGIHSTEDVGEVVFALVEAGVLVAQEEDRREDFHALFDFDEVFEHRYPWSAPQPE